MNSVFNPETIKRENPDAIILATGSKPIIPNIPGAKQNNVFTCIELLLGEKVSGDKVVIIGGGLEGCETALWLARKGKEVLIIEQLDSIINDIHRSNRTMLLDLLEENNVTINVNSKVIGIESNDVIIKNKEGESKKVNGDTIVLAVGMESDNELYKMLLNEGFKELYNIGDSNSPSKIANAVWEGHMLALNL